MIRTLSGAVDRDLAYDVVIVGAGPAGIVLALELAAGPLRVALFEGGGRRPSAVSQARYEGEVSTSDGFTYPPLESFRLRQFGGTSNHWSGWCRPIEQEVFGPRNWLGTEPWPFRRDELEDGYRRAHDWCELGKPEYDVRRLCRSAGLPVPIQPTDTMITPVWRISPPTRFGERYARQLDAAVDVYLEANCVDVEVVGGAARAAHFVSEEGTAHRVEGEHIVLACGAIETSRILLELAANDVADLNASGLLGVGFQEHPHVTAGAVLVHRRQIENPGGRFASMVGLGEADGVRFKVGVAVSPEACAERGLAGVSFTLRSPRPGFAPDEIPHGPAVASLERMRTGRRSVSVPLLVRSEQRFNPASRVSLLEATDDLGRRRVRLDWRVTPEDLDGVTVALGLVARELQAQGLGPVVAGSRADSLEEIRGGGHQLGGARANDDPRLGVVDGDLRCHAVPNLRVCGGAVFPAAGFSNPTLTIVALAVRMAGSIGGAT